MARIEAVDVLAAGVSPPPEQAALRALRGEWVFVVVRAAGGLQGVGEATHSGDDEALARCVRDELGPALIGRTVSCHQGPADRPDALVQRWFSRASAAPDRIVATAVSALEQALCDLAAREAGVSVAAALTAGEASPAAVVQLYATLNRGIFDRSPAGFHAAAQSAAGDGFRLMKCAPFDGVNPGGEPGAARRDAIALGIERVRAARDGAGPDGSLMVDCHGRLSEAEAVAVGEQLAALGVRWLEEPVPFWPDPAPLARVRRAVPLPVAAGELMFGAGGFLPLLEAGAVDVVMPDVKHCGGVHEAARIADLASRHGVQVAPHNPSGPVSTLASAQLCAALPGPPLLEFPWGEVPWRAGLLSPAERIQGGALALPAGPGLGATLDATVLESHRHPL